MAMLLPALAPSISAGVIAPLGPSGPTMPLVVTVQSCGFAERGPRCRIERNRQRTVRKHLRPEVRALVLNLALNHVAFVVNASRRRLVCRGGEKSANWGSVDGKIPIEVRICQRTSVNSVVIVDFRAAACTFVVGVAREDTD